MAMTGRVATRRERARRPAGVHPPSPGLAPVPARMLALQRSYGNRAVTSLVQRTCTGRGCCAACGDRSEDVPAEVVDGATSPLQRQAVDAVSGADPRAPGTDPHVCPDPAEQTRKQAFGARTDMKLVNHIPSAGLGKFDIGYTPSSSALAVTVKLHFSFTDDASAPSGWDLMLALFRGDDLSKVMWDEAQRKDYMTQFASRVHDRWSGAHVIRSVKPCWPFNAIPDVNVVVTDDIAAAHFAVKVHKSTGPGIDYQSGVHNEHLADPTKQPTADFWQSDNQEAPDFNSTSVATTERKRIEAAITAANAGRVFFKINKADLTPDGTAALRQLATALNGANPSAPLIPLIVEGFASAEGPADFNQDLSDQRAQRVADELAGTGIRQPVRATGKGPIGAPKDPNNRAATVAADTAFETTYAANRYSVSEHEFGHMLGNPDEYANATTGRLGTVQTKYIGLVTSAGMAAPVFGEDTSSQMSAGVDVLPRHYVTLWEALAKMTAPDLGQPDWRIG